MDKDTRYVMEDFAKALDKAVAKGELTEELTDKAFFAYYEMITELLRQNGMDDGEELIKMARLNALDLFDEIVVTHRLRLVAKGEYDFDRHL